MHNQVMEYNNPYEYEHLNERLRNTDFDIVGAYITKINVLMEMKKHSIVLTLFP